MYFLPGVRSSSWDLAHSSCNLVQAVCTEPGSHKGICSQLERAAEGFWWEDLFRQGWDIGSWLPCCVACGSWATDKATGHWLFSSTQGMWAAGWDAADLASVLGRGTLVGRRWGYKAKLFGKLCQDPRFSMSERQQTASCEGEWFSSGLTILEIYNWL